MTTINPAHIEPVLAAIKTEVGAAHQLLIGFEHAINHDGIEARDLAVRAQGFDLALQILGDVEHLIKLLGQQFPPGSALPHPLPISGVRLERVRAKLTQDSNQLPVSSSQDAVKAAELF